MLNAPAGAYVDTQRLLQIPGLTLTTFLSDVLGATGGV